MSDIILLRGALGSKDQPSSSGKALKKKGMKVHVFDFFGHGGELFSKGGFGIKVFSWQLQNYIRESKLKKTSTVRLQHGRLRGAETCLQISGCEGRYFHAWNKIRLEPRHSEEGG